MAGYLNTTFGGNSEPQFSIAGLSRLALIEKAKLEGVAGNLDLTEVTGLTIASGASFQEVFFTEESANYTQELTATATSKYITQTLNYRVESDDMTKAHQIILGRQYAALAKTNAGKWIILGLTNGLRTSAATANSTEDDATLSFTMTGKNLGYAAMVKMTDAELDTLINSVEI